MYNCEAKKMLTALLLINYYCSQLLLIVLDTMRTILLPHVLWSLSYISSLVQQMVSSDKCNHGLHLTKKGWIVDFHFVQRWLQEYNIAFDKVGNLETAFKITRAATKKYAVWKDPASMDWLVSYFLRTATKQFLTGKIDMAGVDASFANFFQQYRAVTLGRIDWHEVALIHNADKPTLAIFLRERIPCECMG